MNGHDAYNKTPRQLFDMGISSIPANVYPVRKAHYLVQLKAYQQHGLVLVALIHNVLMHILNRTNVKPARGVNAAL